MTFTRFIETVGITALAACLLLGAQASASTEQQACVSGWEDSSARDYCPNARISWARQVYVDRVICVVNAACAVDVQVGGNPQRISGTVNVFTTDPETLKLCIIRSAAGTDGDSGWALYLAAGLCRNATDAATAVEEGLSAN